MCGEQTSALSVIHGVDGSSPRVRGTGRRADLALSGPRFIPACAGNRFNRSTTASRSSVHPRVCGEQFRIRICIPVLVGSSPRVRGTVDALNVFIEYDRFIPACAGNSLTLTSECGIKTVHPRVCGEQHLVVKTSCLVLGSSPRVRGTASRGQAVGYARRFIPACAGNSHLIGSPLSRRAVHPRVCGEQIDTMGSRRCCPGSSPRVRGTVVRERPPVRLERFIPACAGNRREAIIAFSRSTVHPRVCGEQSDQHRYDNGYRGSSPRVRGTAKGRPDWRRHERFIPACAGNRPYCPKRTKRRPVHPRVCGEQFVERIDRLISDGSSPRVRGTAGTCGMPVRR